MKWFEKHNVPYELYDLRDHPLQYQDYLKLLYYCEPGNLEFLSTRSKAGAELQQDLESLTIDELFRRIQDNPKLLIEPIMMDNFRVLYKYQAVEMTQFLSRQQKQALLKECKLFL